MANRRRKRSTAKGSRLSKSTGAKRKATTAANTDGARDDGQRSQTFSIASYERMGRERERLKEHYEKERERRIAEYEKSNSRLTAQALLGAPPLRIIAEGDSWFDYPIGNRNGIIPPLATRLGVNILNLASAGDEVRYMLGVEQRKKLEEMLERKPPFDILLFSGGGNDVVGDPMCMWIKQWQDSLPPEDHLDRVRFKVVLSIIRAGYEELISIRDRVSPNTWIFLHAYDFPIPNGKGVCFKGPWLKPSLDYRGVKDLADGRAIVRTMLQEFAIMLTEVERSAGKVIFIQTQGTLREDQWANELHPTDPGFDAIVEVFHRAIKARFPDRII